MRIPISEVLSLLAKCEAFIIYETSFVPPHKIITTETVGFPTFKGGVDMVGEEFLVLSSSDGNNFIFRKPDNAMVETDGENIFLFRGMDKVKIKPLYSIENSKNQNSQKTGTGRESVEVMNGLRELAEFVRNTYKVGKGKFLAMDDLLVYLDKIYPKN